MATSKTTFGETAGLILGVILILAILLFFGGSCYVIVVGMQESERERQESRSSQVLLRRGINTGERYSLLALTRESEQITRAQGSFEGSVGFFFLIGGGSVSGEYSQTTQNEYFVGFVADLAGQPSVLRLPASKFDFQFAQVQQPQARFFLKENVWGGHTWSESANGVVDEFRAVRGTFTRAQIVERISTTHIIEQDLGRVVITLSPEQFSDDIAVLQYVSQGMR